MDLQLKDIMKIDWKKLRCNYDGRVFWDSVRNRLSKKPNSSRCYRVGKY